MLLLITEFDHWPQASDPQRDPDPTGAASCPLLLLGYIGVARARFSPKKRCARSPLRELPWRLAVRSGCLNPIQMSRRL